MARRLASIGRAMSGNGQAGDWPVTGGQQMSNKRMTGRRWAGERRAKGRRRACGGLQAGYRQTTGRDGQAIGGRLEGDRRAMIS